MKSLITVLWLYAGFSGRCQQGLSPAVSGFDVARAGAGNSIDVFAASSVHALLTEVKKPAFGFRAFQPFGYQGTGTYVLAGLFPGKTGSLGLAIQHSGFGAWQESQAGFAYAKKLWDGFAAGIKINAYRFAISAYGTDYTFPFELSSKWTIHSKISALVYLSNPISVRLIKSGERLPRIIALGLGSKVTEQIAMGLTIAGEDDKPVVIQGFLSYCPAARIIFNAGFTILQGAFVLSTIYRLRKFKIEISFNYHNHLGVTGGSAIQTLGPSDETQ